jgi:hypothetical protein
MTTDAVELSDIVQQLAGKRLGAYAVLTGASSDGALYGALINHIGSSPLSLDQALIEFRILKKDSLQVYCNKDFIGAVPFKYPSPLPETLHFQYTTSFDQAAQIIDIAGTQVNIPLTVQSFVERREVLSTPSGEIPYTLEQEGLITVLKEVVMLDTHTIKEKTGMAFNYASSLIRKRASEGFASFMDVTRTHSKKRVVVVPFAHLSAFDSRLAVQQDEVQDIELIAEDNFNAYNELRGFKTPHLRDNLPVLTINGTKYYFKKDVDALLGLDNTHAEYVITSSADKYVYSIEKVACVDTSLFVKRNPRIKDKNTAHRILRALGGFVSYYEHIHGLMRGPQRLIVLVPETKSHHVHHALQLKKVDFQNRDVVRVADGRAYLQNKGISLDTLPALTTFDLPGFGRVYLKDHLDQLLPQRQPNIQYTITPTEQDHIFCIKGVALLDSSLLVQRTATVSSRCIAHRVLNNARGFLHYQEHIHDFVRGPLKHVVLVPEQHGSLIHGQLRLFPSDIGDVYFVLASHAFDYLQSKGYSGQTLPSLIPVAVEGYGDAYLKHHLDALIGNISYEIQQTEHGCSLRDVVLLDHQAVTRATNFERTYVSQLLANASAKGFASCVARSSRGSSRKVVVVPYSCLGEIHPKLAQGQFTPKDMLLYSEQTADHPYLLQLASHGRFYVSHQAA